MFNRATLIGYVGQDPETRYTSGGTQCTTFSLATTERWRSKDGQPQAKTEWHNIVAWSGLAKICESYVRKGCKLFVEGKIQTRSWENQNGVKQYKTEIVANNVKFLESTRRLPKDEYEANVPYTDVEDFFSEVSSESVPF